MERETKIPSSRPGGRPELVFGALQNGSCHRHFNNNHKPGGLRKSKSFSGRSPSADGSELARQEKSKKMRRPKTYPELSHRFASELRPLSPAEFPSSNGSKILVNVTVFQSSGALRLLVSRDESVRGVIRAALVLYAKEGRRPLLGTDPASFALHYSQFSMDCLNPTDRVADLGSRNFFVCPSSVTENARMTRYST